MKVFKQLVPPFVGKLIDHGGYICLILIGVITKFFFRKQVSTMADIVVNKIMLNKDNFEKVLLLSLFCCNTII